MRTTPRGAPFTSETCASPGWADAGRLRACSRSPRPQCSPPRCVSLRRAASLRLAASAAMPCCLAASLRLAASRRLAASHCASPPCHAVSLRRTPPRCVSLRLAASLRRAPPRCVSLRRLAASHRHAMLPRRCGAASPRRPHTHTHTHPAGLPPAGTPHPPAQKRVARPVDLRGLEPCPAAHVTPPYPA